MHPLFFIFSCALCDFLDHGRSLLRLGNGILKEAPQALEGCILSDPLVVHAFVQAIVKSAPSTKYLSPDYLPTVRFLFLLSPCADDGPD